MFGTDKGNVKTEIGFRGFGFIQAMRGDVIIDIIVFQKHMDEAGWKAKDFRQGEAVEFEYEVQRDGRYRLTKLHQIGSRLAPAYYKVTVIDRDKDHGLTIVKVADMKSSYTLQYRVLDREGQLQGGYPTLVAARASIGRVIKPPRDVNHGRKTNGIVALPDEKEKKKKAA